jgi:hypothetical protein
VAAVVAEEVVDGPAAAAVGEVLVVLVVEVLAAAVLAEVGKH